MASSEATSAYCEKGSRCAASCLPRSAAASKSLTSAATLTLKASVSKWVMGPMPRRPATMPSHVSLAVLPSGVTAPMPVIATLCSIFSAPNLWARYIAMPPSTRMTSPVT